MLMLRRAPARVGRRATSASARPAEAPADETTSFHWKRVALSWFLCLTYGGVLLGAACPTGC